MNTTIPALLHAQTDLKQYRYEQGDCWKGRITAAVWPTSLCQPNKQTPDMLVLTSYQKFDRFEIWLNSMFEMILNVKIKHDDSRNQNNFVTRIILIVDVLIWSKFTTITFVWNYLCFELTTFNIFFRFDSEDKILGQEEIKTFCYENNFDCGFWFDQKVQFLLWL